MIIENPITRELHKNWFTKVKNSFSIDGDAECLSLIRYLEVSPNKYYSKKAEIEYTRFLSKLSASESKKILGENRGIIDQSIRVIEEINSLNIHNIAIPKDELDILEFIDKNIHYNYLRLLENGFYTLILLPSIYSRTSRSKSISGLDIFNCVEELANTDFGFISEFYNNNIRNGIAHGKIEIINNEFKYIDKKGNATSIPFKQIIKMFDRLLDCLNGFVLSLGLYFLSSSKPNLSLNDYIPQSLLFEELKYQINGPAWEAITSFDSRNINNKRQLNLYIKNDFLDYNKVQFNIFRTAVLTEKFTTGYNRIFIGLKSKNSKSKIDGFAGFNTDKLCQLRKHESSQIEDYKGVMEDNLLFFIPKWKLPKLFYKIGTYRMILKSSLGSYLESIQSHKLSNRYRYKESSSHSKGRYLISPRVSYYINGKVDNEDIKSNAQNIIRLAKKHSKSSYKKFSFKRFLRVRYTRVFIYTTDARVREFINRGLPPSLVCVINMNQTKTIKAPLTYGKVESCKNYEIIWNENYNNNES
ncbi:hypothetical protein [Saccharicrinis fermentans]|uniref:Uncharacterized protein n=1 Tax=Saccharicrinis fermentans DSM 9555 = JCM 21142 TaxID=869213 RepID=W7Y8T2_9BACT|nr:hypothetical protein [Saccharicrinis fermentans]GAF04652.1 hypothetical protein JCM21142_93365 [Saccharicrinis fermentans DSM 9555 = JCM 21142]